MLLCPPTFFRIAYTINPWMKCELVNVDKAMRQWEMLRLVLVELGVTVQELTPQEPWPDLVFTANAGLVHHDKVVLSNFKHVERQGERWIYNDWFEDNGYEVYRLPSTMSFEGRGDAIIVGDKMIGGFGQRSDKAALKLTATILGLDLVTLKLKDPRFYHLDTCLSIINKSVGLYYPAAFSMWSSPKKATGLDLIPVTEEEASNFACNSLSIGNTVIMQIGNDRLVRILKDRGLVVIEIDMSEFMKSGGNCRCLALEVT